MTISATTSSTPAVSSAGSDSKIASLERQMKVIEKQITEESKSCDDEKTKQTVTTQLQQEVVVLQAQIQQIQAQQQQQQVQPAVATQNQTKQNDAKKPPTDTVGQILNELA